MAKMNYSLLAPTVVISNTDKYLSTPPQQKEGQARRTRVQPGVLEIFVEPNNIDLVKSCDNLTIANHGDLVICEDRTTPRIVGITPKGSIYHIADNVGY